MNNPKYLVATIKQWNILRFGKLAERDAQFAMVNTPADLESAVREKQDWEYIFFPHWSTKVPEAIFKRFNCICFHETDVPFGRGGSPIQNLLARGIKQTKITALQMIEELDAGPVLLKKDLSLEGAAEEIFVRASAIIENMMVEIIQTKPVPKAQTGEVVRFKRRTPEQSEITEALVSSEQLDTFIKMLDAESYPHAFIETAGFRLEFTKSILRNDGIEATVKITRAEKKTHAL